MARLPTKADLSGQVSLRSGRPIASWDTSGVGRGFAAAGNALEGLGDDFMRQQARERREGIVLEGAASDGNATKELYDLKRTFDADADYGTFGARFDKGAASIRDKWAAQISDPKARQAWALEFDKSVQSSRNSIIELGNSKIKEGKLVNARTGAEGYQHVIADLNSTDDEKARARTNANAFISGLQSEGLLSPAEADDWRNKIVRGGEFIFGERVIERDGLDAISGKLPSNVSERAGLAMGYLQKRGWSKEAAAGIVGNLLAESSLNTGARNAGDGRDGSDSIGIAQWNSTRARALMKFAGERGKDWRDFETQLAFVDHELTGSHKSIGDRLRAAKDLKEATHAGIMFEGPAGSQNGPENAMHYDKRMKLAAQAAGETIKPDWYTSQSPEDQLRLENLAIARQGEMDRAASADLAAARAAAADSFRLRIATDDPTLTQRDILINSTLDDGDKAALINSFNEAMQTTGHARQLLGAVYSGAPGDAAVNSYDNTQTKVADKAYDLVQKDAPEESLPAVTRAFVGRTGYIPGTVRASLRQGAASTNVGALANAMVMADQFQRLAPSSFLSGDGMKDVSDKLADYRHNIDFRGMSSEQAAAAIIEAEKPENKVSRELLKPRAEKLLKGLTISEVTNSFDGWATTEPGGGLLPAQQNVLLGEYRDLVEQRLYETGDEGTAKARALNDIKQVWNISRVSGTPQLMRYPPELHYPAIAGGHEYLHEDALKTAQDFVGANFPGRKVTGVAIDVDPDRTRYDISEGIPPRYRLFYTYEQNGFTLKDEVLAPNGSWGLREQEITELVKRDQAALKERGDALRSTAAEVGAILERGEADAERAMQETVGPDWMKAKAAQDAREKARMDADAVRMRRPPEPAVPAVPADAYEPLVTPFDTQFGNAM